MSSQGKIRSRRISVLVAVPKILEILREYEIRRFPDLERLESALKSDYFAIQVVDD